MRSIFHQQILTEKNDYSNNNINSVRVRPITTNITNKKEKHYKNRRRYSNTLHKSKSR